MVGSVGRLKATRRVQPMGSEKPQSTPYMLMAFLLQLEILANMCGPMQQVLVMIINIVKQITVLVLSIREELRLHLWVTITTVSPVILGHTILQHFILMILYGMAAVVYQATTAVPTLTNTDQPWFFRQMVMRRHYDIEARMCSDQGFPDESAVVVKIQLYVQ